ncbi:MAG: hypothetical protein KKG00_05725 [Bacteroidetes bacterium]|jgi:hypothetical protein|nr:hypothetical protein [Bacteroidota bacterium]
MKKNAIFIFFAISFSGYLQALSWSAEFDSAHVVNFPVSVGRSSWGGSVFDVSKDSAKEVVEEIFKLSGDEYFGSGYLYWDRGERAYISDYLNSGDYYVSVGKLSCISGVRCYLVDVPRMTFLVTVKDSKIIDSKLVYARHANRNKDGAYSGSGNLDSIFGDGIFWQQLPVTRFEETGIFCSSFVDDVNHKYKDFKRRVNFDGFIESVEISGWRDCKAPW